MLLEIREQVFWKFGVLLQSAVTVKNGIIEDFHQNFVKKFREGDHADRIFDKTFDAASDDGDVLMISSLEDQNIEHNFAG